MKTNEMTLNFTNKKILLSSPIIMGIINCTPDSFYKKSRKQHKSDILKSTYKHLSEGASIIDLGGFSYRPNASKIILSEEEELERVLLPLEWIKKEFPESTISIDTFRAIVANECLKNGAEIINDISGGTFDEAILDVVSTHNCPYISMHLQGNIDNMHQEYLYSKIEKDVFNYFEKKIQLYHQKGINQLIIDPGFGFSKSMPDNFKLLKNLSSLTELNLPILVGISRKRMIYKSLELSSPEDALNGTTILNTIALQNGASILRVHDVKEAMEAIQLTNLLNQKSTTPK